jgi:hypothetical protein
VQAQRERSVAILEEKQSELDTTRQILCAIRANEQPPAAPVDPAPLLSLRRSTSSVHGADQLFVDTTGSQSHNTAGNFYENNEVRVCHELFGQCFLGGTA